MVLASCHTASGETSVHAPQIDIERANSVGDFFDATNSNIGLAPRKPKGGLKNKRIEPLFESSTTLQMV